MIRLIDISISIMSGLAIAWAIVGAYDYFSNKDKTLDQDREPDALR